MSVKWFDACFSSEEGAPVIRYKNTPEGHLEFVREVRSRAKSAHICMEHTGGYETALAIACIEAKFTVSVVDGAKVATYRKSFGSAKAKTDKADARLLAKFCKDRKPARWFPFPTDYQVLRELVKHREDLVEERKRLSCQASHRVQNEFVSASRKAMLQVVLLQIKAVSKEILAHVKASPALKKAVELLTSISGIAFVSAVRILAEAGPVSNYSSAKDYALNAGLIPIPCQSGQKTPPGKLPVYGNKSLRCAFYFPALTCLGKTTGIGAFMARIERNGRKSKMTVIVAGMRKLAYVVFGVLKNQTKFDEKLT